MRVLILNRYLGFRSGVEKFVHDLALALRRAGHGAALAYEEDRKDPQRYRDAFDTAVRLPLHGGEPAVIVGEVIQRARPDVVFAHNLRRSAWVARFAASRPTVQMVHDHESFCLNGKKYFYLTTREICDKPVGAACYARCTGLRRRGDGLVPLRLASLDERRERLGILRELPRVLVCSEFMQRELVRNGVPAERVRVLPVFVDVPAAPDPYPVGSRRVLFVGRLNREKGIDHLLRALAVTPRPWSATVVGEGEIAQARQLAEALRIADAVEFRGFRPFEDVRELYREAAVVVMPSVWPEPLGMVGLEAMAYGRPVVAYDTGGIADWLLDGETGRRVPRGDVDGLARAVGGLLADPAEAERMGARGHVRVAASPYRAERFVAAFDGLVRELLGTDARARAAVGG